MLEAAMADPSKQDQSVAPAPSRDFPAVREELPVVARLIVEVRSDGTRTVARGAMEDAVSGTRAAIEAAGSTPLELALTLAKSIMSAPWFGRQLARGGVRALLRKL
jgi:hypothetical protein